MMSKKRVCIIGAGAAGLGSLRYFVENPETFEVIAYEQAPCIGGNWVYTDGTGSDKSGQPIHSSLYKSLKINIPKEIMAYPDFPFDSNLSSFVGHEEVLKYLNSYTEHFNLKPSIQFNIRVIMVKPKHTGQGLWGTKWDVEVQQLNNPSTTTKREFDAVIVCNGQYAVPKLPDVPGLNIFQGTTIHGHSYREPSIFKDKYVLTVGASFSGWDITIETASTAKQVYLSHRGEQKMKALPTNVTMVTGIKSFTKNSVILNDDRELTIDAIIFNTGYKHSFPFLSPNCGVEVTEDNTVRPLYKHTLNITNPTMSFICLMEWMLPFPCISIQARFIKAVLEERLKLPSEKEMTGSEQEEMHKREERNWPPRYRHRMEDLMFELCDDMARDAGVQPLPVFLRKIFDYHFPKLYEDIRECRKINYRIKGSDQFEIL
ncbi:uncharacterized protein LOC126814258 [Patella vulgata]|uniref:uncharacterized protein LOC126814258 n=1 Tax=Patella vulgata TaxID=6465 RepID=UPI00217FCD13|nr:uncharacterized protein LOC126814258 [Patella vulgata]